MRADSAREAGTRCTMGKHVTQSEERRLRARERVLVDLPAGGDIRTVVVYPNRYWIAMSNLGFQTVLKLFASQPRFSVERAYLPEEDRPATTFESGRPLRDAELIAFSVSFETDYPYVVELAAAAGRNLAERYHPAAAEQNEQERKQPIGFRPLMIGGGAALTLNPEPLANLFDAIAIGEGEGMVEEISACYARAKDDAVTFGELLDRLSLIPGIYVPSLHRPVFREDDTIERYETLHGAPPRPLRRYLENIDAAPTHTVIQTPETEFKAMFMTETGRGCEVGCRFCVAGYMYRPVRKRSGDTIAESVRLGLETSDSIGFVGAAVSSHPKIAELASTVARAGKRAALSSIMSQRVSRELAMSLTESEYKTVALAPEAGSERLRFRVGKRVCDDQIVEAVATLAENGIRNFKLYFIIGLPGEESADVDAIVSLVRRARDRALEAARTQEDFRVAPKILLSVNPFIPKAWTPFQRHRFLGSKEVRDRLDRVRRGVMRIPNVEMRAESPRESYFQALMSRGDRRVGNLLLEMHRLGKDWKWLASRGGERLLPDVPPADFYVLRTFREDETLPWEVVDLRIKRTLLEREYRRTFEEDVTSLIARARSEFAAAQAEGRFGGANS